MKRSKNYKSISEKIEKRPYEIQEAMQLLTKGSKLKFDETIEMHIRLDIEPKKGDQQVRSSVTLPHGSGKETKIAVLTTTAQKEAQDAGADLVGGEEIIADIKSGKFFEKKYDVLVATPEMMPKIAPVARILGPRGLMPNPKTETVTTKVKETLTSLKKGKVQFKNDAQGNIHQAIGKCSMGVEKLTENAEGFLEAVRKAKPSAVKGKFIIQTTLCSTMSPSIVLNVK
jgi:large subunit ribosomal protein L1